MSAFGRADAASRQSAIGPGATGLLLVEVVGRHSAQFEPFHGRGADPVSCRSSGARSRRSPMAGNWLFSPDNIRMKLPTFAPIVASGALDVLTAVIPASWEPPCAMCSLSKISGSSRIIWPVWLKKEERHRLPLPPPNPTRWTPHASAFLRSSCPM